MILGVGATLEVTATKRTNTPWVRLTNDTIGAAGNEPITETVVDADFQVTGMRGGGGADCPATTACATGSDCLSGICTANVCQ